MVIKEKVWSDRIYEIVFYEKPDIRYKLSLYKYPLSNVKLVKYSHSSTFYKVLFDEELNKKTYMLAKKLVKHIMQKEYEEGEQYGELR